MTHDMKAETTALPATPTEADKVKAFMQQMIPHHANAVAMSKVLLKLDEAEVDAVDAGTEDAGAFKSMLHSIINVQNYQIHYFRNCAQQSSWIAGSLSWQ